MGAITKPGVLCTVQVTFCQFLFIFLKLIIAVCQYWKVFVLFCFVFFMLTLSCIAVTTTDLFSFELIVELLTDVF